MLSHAHATTAKAEVMRPVQQNACRVQDSTLRKQAPASARQNRFALTKQHAIRSGAPLLSLLAQKNGGVAAYVRSTTTTGSAMRSRGI